MAIKKRPISPRQKMINLVYIVLMAMLALNVSADVLDGFSLVDENIRRSNENSTKENSAIYQDFAEQMKNNPDKVSKWYNKAKEVRQISDSLYNFVDKLKISIVMEADGEEADVKDIEAKDDVEATNRVMLASGHNMGEKLLNNINAFRNEILSMIDDETQRAIINSNLSTEVPQGVSTMGKNWQEYMFENTPVAAAVTLLTKIQSDVRYAEGEVLHTLKTNIDNKDMRVNALSAFVIPNSQTIIRGNKFSARIVMAAIDTTNVPEVFVGNNIPVKNGLYETVCNKSGKFNLSGYIKTAKPNGGIIRSYFSQEYNVIEPAATVSADMMNVLYAGYPNPISISVPGVSLNNVQCSIVGGSLQQTGLGKYIVKPFKVGSNVTITVSANSFGKSQTMGTFTFNVRKLPDPTPYINIGGMTPYKGGALSKDKLISNNVIGAAIDDGLLNIEFRVISFETIFFDGMGNAKPMASNGNKFSARQLDTIKKLSRNRRMYISQITVKGSDGIERRLNSPMEIIIK